MIAYRAPVIALPDRSLLSINRHLMAHRLRVERIGSEYFVTDDDMPGSSFGLPIGTPSAAVSAEAIRGARARRDFIRGNASDRSAA